MMNLEMLPMCWDDFHVDELTHPDGSIWEVGNEVKISGIEHTGVYTAKGCVIKSWVRKNVVLQKFGGGVVLIHTGGLDFIEDEIHRIIPEARKIHLLIDDDHISELPKFIQKVLKMKKPGKLGWKDPKIIIHSNDEKVNWWKDVKDEIEYVARSYKMYNVQFVGTNPFYMKRVWHCLCLKTRYRVYSYLEGNVIGSKSGRWFMRECKCGIDELDSVMGDIAWWPTPYHSGVMLTKDWIRLKLNNERLVQIGARRFDTPEDPLKFYHELDPLIDIEMRNYFLEYMDQWMKQSDYAFN